MAFVSPTPIHAEDPLAYFVALPVTARAPATNLRPMTALDQMYAYYDGPASDRLRQS